jgi:hypothetical protein
MISNILKISFAIMMIGGKPVVGSTSEPISMSSSTSGSTVNVTNNDSHPTLYNLDANGQTCTLTTTELVTLANILTKGKTPSALKISPEAFSAIQASVSFLSGAAANQDTTQTAQNMQILLTNLIAVKGSTAMKALGKMGAKDATNPLNLALTAVAAATTPTQQLIREGKITPEGCCGCILGTALTFAQILAKQQMEANQGQ